MRKILLILFLGHGSNVFAQWKSDAVATGWNADIFAEGSSGAATAASSSTTNGFSTNAYVWCTDNFRGPNNTSFAYANSLPANGLIYTSDPYFQLQPYNASNALLMTGEVNTTASLSITNSFKARKLAILIDRNYGAHSAQLIINYSDATSETFTYEQGSGNNVVARYTHFAQRSNSSSRSSFDVAWGYCFFEIAESNQTKFISSITFRKLSSSSFEDNIFAISYLESCSTSPLVNYNTTVTNGNISQNNFFRTYPYCNTITTLQPAGANPVAGSVSSKLWVDATQPAYNGQPYLKRHFEIVPADNASTATGRVTLYAAQSEFDAFNSYSSVGPYLPTSPTDVSGISNLKIFKYSGTSTDGTGSPGSYVQPGIIINPDDANIVWDNVSSRWAITFDVTGFSGFFIGTGNSVLPLSLLDFSGHIQNNNALLQWKTDHEVNTSTFEIEKSIDGRNYSSIGTKPAYNSEGVHQYNFADVFILSLNATVVYYRLKQIDIDGRFTYSRIIALPVNSNKAFAILYPNPVNTELNISMSSSETEKIKYQIIDVNGRTLKDGVRQLSAGANSFSIDVNQLTIGSYYLMINGNIIHKQLQFVKE